MNGTATPSGPDWGLGRYERTAQALFPAARVLVKAAQLSAGEQVLDLGSGTGNAALLAAAAGAVVTAIDPSPRLLSVASAAAQEQGLRLQCHVGDAASIPFRAAHFDCVLSNFGIIFAPDPDAAVTEVSRVLKNDGRAVFTAWLPDGPLVALASTFQGLVLAALGAPAPGPGFQWHDEAAVDELVAKHGMRASGLGRHELVFTAPSPEAFLDAELANHPLAVAGMQVLQQSGHVDSARDRLLRLMTEHNEDLQSFRSTSRYVVLWDCCRAG